MISEFDALRALPVAVHTASAARQSATDIAKFEAMVGATDAMVASSMRARRLTTALYVSRCEGGQDETLAAVLAAIGAITNANTVPPPTDSKRDLVKWTLTTIRDSNEESARAPSGHAPYAGMGPDQAGACMELIGNLNSLLGGNAA